MTFSNFDATNFGEQSKREREGERERERERARAREIRGIVSEERKRERARVSERAREIRVIVSKSENKRIGHVEVSLLRCLPPSLPFLTHKIFILGKIYYVVFLHTYTN